MTGDGVARGTPLRADDPRQLGEYALLRRLGEGGMGSVYLAENAAGQPVAVKVIRADLVSETEFRRRFRSEVARAQEVPPFCTAEVLDADPDHETPYLVVEYVDGPSLADVVVDRGPLTPANLYGVAIGVATALVAIHGAGVIHRDLKPSNVLLAPGSPKVIDFGIARAAEATDGDTRTDQLIGTVAYMAPERLDPTVDHRNLTPAADIFAWGAVVTFAATGRVPFVADSSPATAVAILTQPPDLAGVPEPLRALVARSLHRNPKRRPTARELLDELLSTAPRRAPVVAPSGEPAPAAGDDAGKPPEGTDPRLTSGLRAAYVDVTSEQPVITPALDATRVGRTELVPMVPIPASGRSLRWRRIGIGVLVLCVLASLATLGAILAGVIHLPTPVAAPSAGSSGSRGSGAPNIPGTPSTSPSPPVSGSPSPPTSPSPSTDPSLTGTPTPTLTVGLSDPLTGPFYWQPNFSNALGATCGFHSHVLQARLARLTGTTSFLCRGPVNPYGDFVLAVDVRLDRSNSCAGIWFRFSGSGYVLRVCHNRMQLGKHLPNGYIPLHDIPLSTPIPIGTWARIGITASGPSITVFRCAPIATNAALTVCAPTDVVAGSQFTDNTYTGGKVTLGIFEPDGLPIKQTYQVSFANILIETP